MAFSVSLPSFLFGLRPCFVVLLNQFCSTGLDLRLSLRFIVALRRATAAWLLDCVFTGLLHPPGFKCYPTANAPRHPTQEPENAFPRWVSQLVQSLQDEVGQRDAPLSTERKVDVMEAVCVVSLGGAAKSHLLEFYHKLQPSLSHAASRQEMMEEILLNLLIS